MFKNFKFKKIAGKFFRNRLGSAEAKEINPRRDWNIILTFFALMVFAIIALGSYMYQRINSGSFFVTTGGNESPIETIDRSELKKITRYYESKRQLFEESKVKKSEVIDPSI